MQPQGPPQIKAAPIAGPSRKRYGRLPPQSPAYAPELDLAPPEFLAGLTGHYLYAALNEVLYSSLMAENRQRHAHMDLALKKLEEDSNRLRLAYNAQRQEDITEEIEIILLSAGMLSEDQEGLGEDRAKVQRIPCRAAPLGGTAQAGFQCLR